VRPSDLKNVERGASCAPNQGNHWGTSPERFVSRQFLPVRVSRLCDLLKGTAYVPAERMTTMAWNSPTLIEICIGLEINGYLPAEF
jgi:coenzyme PQQ precursor peptide PqqA